MGKHEESMEVINYYLAKKESGKRITLADEADLVREITVSKMTGKLESFSAISTSHWNCGFCKKCAKIPGSICPECYVDKYTYRKGLVRATERNKLILDNFEIHQSSFKKLYIPCSKLRYQTHGETETSTCARNFIRISKATGLNSALWEKNSAVCIPAFEELGKPKKMKLIHSSLMKNKVSLPPVRLAPYVDGVFTVCEDDFAEENGIIFNCKKQCNECFICYCPIKADSTSAPYREYKAMCDRLGLPWRGYNYYIFERLKKGAKKGGE